MEETEVPSHSNFSSKVLEPVMKSGLRIPLVPPADNIISNDQEIEDPNVPENSGNPSSKYLMIFAPLVFIFLILALAATIRWKYKLRNQTLPSKNKCSSNNNNQPYNIEEGRKSSEGDPLNRRNASTSSSTSTVSRSILVDGSLPVTVSMRILPEVQNQEILESNRGDLYCKIDSNLKESVCDSLEEVKEIIPTSVETECEVFKEKSSEIKVENCENNLQKPKSEAKSVQFAGGDAVTSHPKRPQTLQVMTVVDGNAASDTNCSKGFPWSEQLWTPDADVIYEDTDSPSTEQPQELQKEERDCLFPLMAKGRFKMKPKGLLERRGSNVALTISLKNEEKSCASPPPSSRSPKPLVYLRTASAPLDPLQLHLKSVDTARLQQEFWEVPMNHPSEKHFSIPGYGTKNRYRSILPNPHSRVLLPATPSGDPLSAYINANYIRSYSAICETERRRLSEDGKENDARRVSMKRKAGYIATQGPMANTIVDFWKMVWKENSNAIVMITKLKERKEKCAEYMPSAVGEKQVYENFEVEIKHVRYADHYTVRTIELRNNEEEGEVHNISHFWYSEWLDHETPEKLRGLLTLVQEVAVKCPDHDANDHGPVVIHCSAGIGRTGCFIAISIAAAQLRAEAKVDILKTICQLRMDRGGMIQTWEQYQYVHVALSRYARMLAGENVATPSTAGSLRSPNSRHSTPGSGGIRLFSPKVFVKPDNIVPDGADSPKTPPSGNVLKTTENHSKELNRSEVDRSIFSPAPTKAFSNSRFTFSAALSPHKDPQKPPSSELSNGGAHAVQNGDDLGTVAELEDYSEDEPRSDPQKTSKRTKKSLPPQLILKINSKPSLARNENWLINGHCSIAEEDMTNRNDSESKINGDCDPENSTSSETRTCNGDTTNESNATHHLASENVDLKSSHPDASVECRTPASEEAKSFFTFPAPDK